MKMATTDLIQLIDLSLGSEPCGVVNFNYLHGLLHEIVKRLESLQVPAATGLQVEATREGEEKRADSTLEQEPPGGEQQVQPSGSSIRRFGSHLKSKSSIVSAANDLSALERKLQELELRMGTMESLPEILERKSSDISATPVHDMWNFTNLNNRMSATEDGLGKVSK